MAFVTLILDQASRTGEDILLNTPSSLKMGFTRFIAGMIMHVVVSDEIQNGLKMMKYSCNHWWKFKSP